MRRFLSPFILIFTTLLALMYFYAAVSLTETPAARVGLFLPFLLAWCLPVFYWGGTRETKSRWGEILHLLGFVAMGWLSFLIGFLILHDLIFILARLAGEVSFIELMSREGPPAVLGLSILALVLGLRSASRGPNIRYIDIPFANLKKDLEGYTIVQISDLHIGPTIGRKYVEKVVHKTLNLAPDLIALTGDIVDGSVKDLADAAEPLKKLGETGRAYFAMGNHDYYSGATAWTAKFREMGLKVLLNSHVVIKKDEAKILVAGVVDPAVKMIDATSSPDPSMAIRSQDLLAQSTAKAPADFRLLLAHNPKIAADAAKVGFDLQISGHTHGGQFFPWTLVVRWVHRPHHLGRSLSGKMQVYVSAGTGSWGPPVRLGTQTELTVIRLRNEISRS